MECFNTPVLSGEAILSLIPQRNPIVMVDSFYGIHDNSSYSGLTVLESNLFCANNRLDECGVVEHIAQSAAVRIGYLYKEKNLPVPLGFIASVNKMTFLYLPVVGDKLQTTITVEQEIFDITLISARVQVNETIVAEGQLKIFIKK